MTSADRPDAVQVLKNFIDEMQREGCIAYIDESTQRVFRRVDGQLVEETSCNAHLFPEAAIWIPVTEVAP